jgi:hypothetical protein
MRPQERRAYQHVIFRLRVRSQLIPTYVHLFTCSFFDAKVPPLGIPLCRRDPDSGKRTKESLAESRTQAMLPTPLSVENGTRFNEEFG